MKKMSRVLAAVLALVLLITGCGGRVNGVNRIIGDSELYSETEIESAMSVVIRKFRSDFDGCTLLELSYDEEKTAKEQERHMEKGETDKVMVLSSKFYVAEGDGSLSPGTTYEGWTWELTRSGFGGWKLTNYGFA
ncbi:MAG: hypothetical protein J6I98_07935 [Clostridia bacterium]|nr:hypothetical protein [Clostridia bacterium]